MEDLTTQLENAMVARLRTGQLISEHAHVDVFPDDPESYEGPQGKALIFVRYVDDVTEQESSQGARRDKLRNRTVYTFEIRYRVVSLRGHRGTNKLKREGFELLSGFFPEVSYPGYTVQDWFSHQRGGVVGRIKEKGIWDFFDSFEIPLIYEKRLPN